jgi:photosystem II stability/assembly factor-like uncharacterized protein
MVVALTGARPVNVMADDATAKPSHTSWAPTDARQYGDWRSSRIGGGGFIQNVVLHPTDANRAYAYTDVSGPYRSDDGGNTWRMLQGNLPARRGNYSTRGLVVDPRNPDHLIVALGSAWDPQEGVYVSTDGGATFEQTLKASFVNGSRRNSGFVLARDPSNPDVVYAAAINTGVHRSDDNGKTWTKLGPEGLNPGGLVVDRANPERLWLSTVPRKDWVHQKHLEFPGGFYRTQDGGASWKKLDDEGPKEILQDPKNPARLYGTFDGKPGVRISTDAGATWQPLVEGLDTSGATWKGAEGWNALAAGPNFVVVANGDGMFFRMPAGGAKWQRIEREGIHDAGWYASSENDKKDGGWTHFGKALGTVTIDPRDPNHWFFTDWYALYQSHDGGKNWKLSIDGIEVTVIHNLLQDPTDPGLVHLGMADNGYFRSTNGGETFDQVRLAANIKDLTASPMELNRLWGVGPSEPGAWAANLVYASADRGQTWSKSPMEGLPDMGKHRCNSIAADPREAGVLYLAVSGEVEPDKGGVYRSDDGGGSWRWVGQGLPNGTKFFRDDIWAIGREIAIGADGVLVAISRDGRHVYRYDPAAAEWAKASLDLPNGTRPMSVAADWTTPGRFAIGVSGDAKAAGVYVSDDAGRTWQRTYDRTGASHVTFDRAVPNRAAAATMDGVIVSTDGARSWQVLDRSLPERVDANPMAFAGDRLVIGSAGAGAFWIPLTPAAAAPVAAKPEPAKRAVSFDDDATATHGAADESGVLANGNFSTGDAAPDEWSLGWKTTADKFKLQRDTNDFVSAPASMAFATIAGPAHGSAAQALKLDRLGGDKAFRISLSTKSQPAGVGKEFELAQVVIQAMDDQYKQLSWEIVADLTGVRDWQQFSKRVRLPANTRHASVMLMIQGDGKAWLDDVVVRPATPPAGADMAAPAESPAVRMQADVPHAWASVPMGAGGFVTGVVTHPADADLLLIRTDVGGAFRRDYAGNRWTPLMDGLPFEVKNFQGVEGLAVAPGDPNVIYAAAGASRWEKNADVIKSVDGGRTWQRTNLRTPDGKDVTMEGNGADRQGGERLAVHPVDANIVYFASRNDGLFRTTDGGVSWSPVDSFPTRGEAWRGLTFVTFAPADGKTSSVTPAVYVGAAPDKKNRAASPGGIYTSGDAGRTWRRITGSGTNGPVEGFSPMRGEAGPDGAFYVAGRGDDGTGGVWRLHGSVWQDITPEKGKSYAGIAVSAADPRLIVVGEAKGAYNSALYRSRDGGATWDRFTAQTKNWTVEGWPGWQGRAAAFASPSDIAFDRRNPKRIWAGFWYGAWSCDDITADRPVFRSEHPGLELLCINDLICPPVPAAPLLSAVLDTDGFVHTSPMDGEPTAALSANPAKEDNRYPWGIGDTSKIDFCETQPLHMARTAGHKEGKHGTAFTSRDGGQTWTPVATQPFDGARNGRIAVSATNPDVMVWAPMGDDAAVYRTADLGKTWTLAAGAPEGMIYGGFIYPLYQPLVADRARPDTFYIYDRRDGKFLRSTDGGANFKHIADLPQQGSEHFTQHTLAAAPGIEGELWLAADDKGLFRSTDGGERWTKLTGITRAYRIAVGPSLFGNRTATTYVFGEIAGSTTPGMALYRSTDAGATWARANDDRVAMANPNVIAIDRQHPGRVYVGTGGRGIFVGTPTATPAPATVKPAAMVDIQPPPSMMLLPAEWKRLPDVIAADPNAQAVLARLVARAEMALAVTPSPIPVLVYQGYLEAHPDRVLTKAALGDMDHLRALSWAWAATGEERFADKAVQLLVAWVSTYEPTGNSINENKLDATITSYDLLRDRLTPDERQRTETWLRKMADLQIRTGNIGENDNWGAKRLKIVLLIGAALGEQKWVDHGVAGAKRLIAAGLHPDGTSEDLHRRDAMSYHTSCLKNLMELALAARRSGGAGLYDYKSPSGSSIRGSVDYVVPYAKGEQQHSEWDSSKEPLDRQRWEAGDTYYRPGKPWDRRRGREMFILASYFDAQLAPLVDLLATVEPAPISGPPSPDEEWLRVLLRTASSTGS